MASFVNRFNDTLRSHSEVTILNEARDAFASPGEENDSICLHLQADTSFLEKLLDKLENKDTDLEVSIAILEIVYHALYSHVPATTGFVNRWLHLVYETKFLTSRASDVVNGYTYATTVALALSITMEIIESIKGLSLGSDTLQAELYVSDPTCLMEMHDLILSLVKLKELASTVRMAWGIYLHQLLLRITNGESYDPAYQVFVDHVFADTDLEPHCHLIEGSINSRVHDSLAKILDSLPTCHEEKYLAILLTFFSDTQTYVQLSDATTVLFTKLVKSRALAVAAWENPATRRFLDSARQQFPHDHRPFLQMIKALAFAGPSTLEYLERVPTFTQTMPIGFKGYTVLSEEGRQTMIQLTHPLELYNSDHENNGVIITPGSRGIMVSNPHAISIVLWQYHYSALQYLARVLRFATISMTTGQHAEIIKDILTLFARLVSSCDEVEDFLQHVADEVSEELEKIVSEVFEQTLENRGDMEILIECINFFEELLKSAPNQGWSSLVRLSLFGNGTNNSLADIVSRTDASAQSYQLLIAVCRLVGSGVSDLCSSSLKVTDRLHRAKLQFFLVSTKHLCLIHQTYFHWPAPDNSTRLALGTALSRLFYQIIRLHAGNHLEAASRTQQVREIIDAASQHILNEFSGPSSMSGTQMTSLSTAIEGCSSSAAGQDSVSLDFADCVFRLHGTILRLPRRSDTFPASLGQVAFSNLPRLVTILQLRSNARHVVMSFLLDLLNSAGYSLPSILASLGAQKRDLKLMIFHYLDFIKSCTEAEACTIWRMVESLLCTQQEGIALYLLEVETDPDLSPSLLQRLVKHLMDMRAETWSPKEASYVLRVLCAALNWPSLVHDQLQVHTNFWSKLEQLFEMCNVAIGNQSDEALTSANSYRLVCAGSLAKILASLLSCASTSERGAIELHIINVMRSLSSIDLAVGHYRASLHGNLSRNVSQKYPGFVLQALAKTSCLETEYGESFYYDFDLAKQLIPANSFLRELRIANFNLSLLDAQNARIQGYQVLVTSLAIPCVSSETVWHSLMSAVMQMMSHREDAKIPIMSEVYLERASTVSYLLRALCKSAPALRKETDCLNLLEGLVLSLTSSFDDQNSHTLTHMRLIIPALCDLCDLLARIPLTSTRTQALQRDLTVIFDITACRLGTMQANTLRSAGDNETLHDLEKIVLLGQNIANLIKVHNLSTVPFAVDLAQSGATEAAVRLFCSCGSKDSSGSDRLDQAEISLQLLLMHLEVSGAAEQVTHVGIFRMFLDSQICLRIQNDGLWLQNNASAHNIWTKGVLPLVLFLVNSLGSRIKDEIEIFVNTYSKQIQVSLDHWERPSFITLEQIEELLLVLLLIKVFEEMQNDPASQSCERNDHLNERISYLKNHPKTTSALIQPPSTQEAVLAGLEDVLNLLQRIIEQEKD